MTDAAATDGTRHLSLDAIRGIAVMGILTMNVLSFGLPDGAYMNPLAWGHGGPADLWTWATTFVLFEGKMRGLFSVLFGASMALVVDTAFAKGADGRAVHYRRIAWLFVFGLAHFILLWNGDILMQYALIGAIAFLFLRKPPASLRRWAIGLLTGSFLLHAAMMGGSYFLRFGATQPDATPQLRQSYREMLQGFAKPGSPTDREALATMTSDYGTIVADRAGELVEGILATLTLFGLETLGLMVLGILLLRIGFLTAEWPSERYRRWATRAYGIGLPPSILLPAWNWRTGFEPLDTFATFLAWAEPFKYAVLLGHAALAMLLIKRFAGSALMARIAAVGRAAFSNYLGTSLVATAIFHGWGLGLFGQPSRWELYLFVLAVWCGMLLWSKPWLERFRYGPLEWLWRSLARGRVEPLRR